MSEETAWIAERDTILKPHGVRRGRPGVDWRPIGEEARARDVRSRVITHEEPPQRIPVCRLGS
jgi:hypothetical protein